MSWQIAYMGFKASSRKILQETFSNNTSDQIKLKKKIKETKEKKRHVVF